MNELTVKFKNEIVDIYPYSDLKWEKQVDRFGFSVPQKIIDRTMGKSVCNKCKQHYSGNQPKCTRLNWGYIVSNWHDNLYFGNRFNGESLGTGFVKETGQYECNGYLIWDLESEFSKQQQLFQTFNYIIHHLSDDYKPEGFNLTLDQREKLIISQKVESLAAENLILRSALKEIVQRLNNGGSGLMGGINF